MTWETTTEVTEALVGRKVRLYRSSGFCLIAGRVLAVIPGGVQACGHEHGAGLRLDVDFEDPELAETARQWARDALIHFLPRGMTPIYGVRGLRVEVQA